MITSSLVLLLGLFLGLESLSGREGLRVHALPPKLFAPDAEKFDNFGEFVDLYDNMLAVSSTLDDDFVSRSGSVYMFHLSSNGSKWVFDDKLSYPDPLSSTNFGSSLSFSRGNHSDVALGVGARNYDSSGRAYIFTLSGVTQRWSLQATLIPEYEYLQYFGASGSFYGDTYVVGAYGEDNSEANTGAAYVFRYDNTATAWSQHAILTRNIKDLYMARAVTLRGDVLAVSADGYQNSQGAVIMYYRTGSSWSENAILTAANGDSSDHFGSAVALGSNTLVVGAEQYWVNKERPGAAYIFGCDATGQSWSEQSQLVPADGRDRDWFGDNIALSEKHLIVTSPQSDNVASLSGAVYLYQREDVASWNFDFMGLVMAPDAANHNQHQFGISVAVEDDMYVVGAHKDDDLDFDTGAVYSMNTTIIPTQMPSSLPSSHPTIVPTSSPSISSSPTLSTEAFIHFSVTQEISDLNIELFLGSISNQALFLSALTLAVPLLQIEHVEVAGVTTSPSSNEEFSEHSEFLTTTTEVAVVSYNVSFLVYSNGFSSPNEAYDALSFEIYRASEHGVNSTLTEQLQSQGGIFKNCSVTDISPGVSAFVIQSLNSLYPTSLPSLSPSCGSGAYIVTSGNYSCVPCPPGTYASFGGAEVCSECDIGYYADTIGTTSCTRCPWPMTNLKTGWSNCNAVAMGFSDLHIAMFSASAVFTFIAAVTASQNNKLTSAVICLIPMLDISTDMLYIAGSKFVNIRVFLASVICALLLPIICFVSVLVNMGASPRLCGFTYLRPLLWLGHNGFGYPTVAGKQPRFFALQFVKHDSILKIMFVVLYWVILSLVQIIFSLPIIVLIVLHIPVLFMWILLGSFLFQIKVLSIGHVWNLWFAVWTGGTEFNTELDLNVKFFNKSLLAEFLVEALPQNFIMWFNNTRTHVWSLTAYASAVMSLFMTIDGIWRICYYKLYSKQPFEDIPVGFGIVKVDNKNSISKDSTFSHKSGLTMSRPSSMRQSIQDTHLSESGKYKNTELVANPMQYSGFSVSSHIDKA